MLCHSARLGAGNGISIAATIATTACRFTDEVAVKKPADARRRNRKDAISSGNPAEVTPSGPGSSGPGSPAQDSLNETVFSASKHNGFQTSK